MAAETAYLVRCGECGFIGDPEPGHCAKCGYDGIDPPSDGGVWVRLDLDDDARRGVLWALDNGEAALRTEKRSWPEPATSNLSHLKRGADVLRTALAALPQKEKG